MVEMPDEVTWTSDPDEYQEWRERWEPYVSGPETPSGEIEAHCAEHEDHNPSAQLNFWVGAWKCYSCGSQGYFSSPDGDELAELMDERDGAPEWVTTEGGYSKRKVRATDQMPSKRQVKAWAEALFEPEFRDQLVYMTSKRRIDREVLRERMVGYSDGLRAYTVPLLVNLASPDSTVENVKFRAQHEGNKRMWTVTGATTHVLWPDDALTEAAITRCSQDLYIVEGEMDILTAETMGMRAVTSGGGAHGKWDAEWSRRIASHMSRDAPEGNIWVIPDFDDAGEAFAARVVASLRGAGMSPRVLRLPFDPDEPENEGADLNDLLKEMRTPRAARDVLSRAADEAVGSGEADHVVDVVPEEDDRFERQVAKEQQRLSVRREAEKRESDLNASRSWEVLDSRTLTEHVEDGVPEVSYRVNHLMPEGANTLLIGRDKAGKTTLMGNLMRSLVSGEHFMDNYAVWPLDPDQTIVMFNYEVGHDQLLRWLVDMGLEDYGEQVIPVTLRGRRVDLSSDFVTEQIIRFLQDNNAAVWIPDPFARAFGGDENINSEVSAWLEHLDEIKERAGVSELVMTTHSGKTAESGARGASRLQDWPDAIWKLAVGRSGSRLFSAYGRDVEVEPAEELVWKAQDRRMVIGVNPVEVRCGEILYSVEEAGGEVESWHDLIVAVLGDEADPDAERRGQRKRLWDAALEAAETRGLEVIKADPLLVRL